MAETVGVMPEIRKHMDMKSIGSRREIERGSLIDEIISDLGLTLPERSVFLCLLGLGSRQAAAVAKRAAMSRTHVYEVLGRLVNRGFVLVKLRSGVRVYSCVALDELLGKLAVREALLARRREQLAELIRAAGRDRESAQRVEGICL